jgi:PD-(D/E)XK nuclease superfamily protein
VIQTARRRAALCAALAELAPSANEPVLVDPSRLDGYVALFDAAQACAVDTPSLALAAAEGDDATSMIARVFLTARAWLGDGPNGEPGDVAQDESVAALARLIEAAIVTDDEVVIRFLASADVGLDIAHVRAARRMRSSEPMQAALGQALDAFPGVSQREIAAHASTGLRAIAGAAAEESATLESLLRAGMRAATSTHIAAPLSDDVARSLCAAADGADAVWRGATQRLSLRYRARHFLDALLRPAATSASWPIASPSFMSAGASVQAVQPDRDRNAESLESASPWVWPVPEVDRPVVAPPMTFSASRLNAYVKCGRRWFFEYLCDAVADEGSIQATYGRVLHEALEALHQRESVFSEELAPATLAALLYEIDTAFSKSRRAFATPWEHAVSRLQARRIAPHYVAWLVEQAKSSPATIVALEAVHRLRAGGHDFVGYIDRIDQPVGGGPVTIYDYKTGRIAANPAKYLADVRSGDESQLPLYYFMCRAAGSEVGRVALVSVRDPEAGVRVLALDIVDDQAIASAPAAGAAVCSTADLDAALAAILKRCDLLTQTGLKHFVPGEDPPCGYCAYAAACRERPLPKESIFAR